jgi:hypothetical protein
MRVSVMELGRFTADMRAPHLCEAALPELSSTGNDESNETSSLISL